MNCGEAQHRIRAELEAGAAVVHDREAAAHLDQCELCRQRYGDLALELALAPYREVTMREGFADEAIAKAVARNRRAGNGSLQRVGALAASVAAVALLVTVLVGSPGEPPGDGRGALGLEGPVVLAPDRRRTVQLLIDSPAHRAQATITIELAENLELEGFPAHRVIEWQTELLPGKNLLALPLELRDQREGHFSVLLRDGERHEEIRVTVRPDGSVARPAERTSV